MRLTGPALAEQKTLSVPAPHFRGQVTLAAVCRSKEVEYERFDAAMQQLVCSRTQLDALVTALAPEQLAGFSPQEAAVRTELAGDALQLLEVTEAAIDSGEPENVLVALVNAVDVLAVQLRDRVLNGVVASIPPLDQ
ncbi:hypothetical protein [Streptomyces sp. V1I1]|uniref:hypothetical protein n=1 Tax=Streptomyces sp. V1I1 TaxID=3042272 RepID=UPI00277D442B|nr:hypothetical protein [Streptomyces sp. V1I1]MDQ0942779.1 hypothetical protein [Streptomyces sp. V1I1]